MNKGLALNIVVAVIIAIAGVSLLLLTMTGILPNVSKQAYCRAYTGIITVLPSPSEGEPRVPDYCVKDVKAETKTIRSTDSERVARKIAASTIACWNDVEKMGIMDNHTCFDLSFPNGIPKVSEKDVTKIMAEEGGCRYLQNARCCNAQGQCKNSGDFGYECGSRERLLWQVSGKKALNGQKKILIEYFQTGDQRFIIITG